MLLLEVVNEVFLWNLSDMEAKLAIELGLRFPDNIIGAMIGNLMIPLNRIAL